MKDIKSIFGAILLLILIGSGVFSFLLELTGEYMKLILWLFQLSLTDFGLSPFVEIAIKSITFVLSYALVGIIFNSLGFFNSDVMKFVYFVVSTLVGFALSAVIMFFSRKYRHHFMEYIRYIINGNFIVLFIIKRKWVI